MTGQDHPRARKKDLVVRVVEGETLVYDPGTYRAYCLDAGIASLWRRCDGRTSAARLASALKAELGQAVPEEVVRVGLHRLAKARLLEMPGPAAPARRQWLRQATLLGLSIASVGVPTLAEAATAISNAACAARPAANCGGAPCSQNSGNFCRRVGSACSCSQN